MRRFIDKTFHKIKELFHSSYPLYILYYISTFLALAFLFTGKVIVVGMCILLQCTIFSYFFFEKNKLEKELEASQKVVKRFSDFNKVLIKRWQKLIGIKGDTHVKE